EDSPAIQSAGIEPPELQRTIVLTGLIECRSAGAEASIPAIDFPCFVAFGHALLERTSVAQHVRQIEVRIGTARPPGEQLSRIPQRVDRLPALRPEHDQLCGC